MKYILVIKEPVNIEITEAFEYYEKTQIGLGIKLLEAIDEALKSIKLNPVGFQIKYKVYRTRSTKPFPYVLIYEVNGKEIIVYQFFCTKKDPRKKFRNKN
ncbi:MAG: type II toxin-antitoxin system RelE/ParE family toxin [Sphingobacteriaceae bacterium]|jgi:hypothetical protein|nr:type II toxin-antitoxin system RelE/ParE family toxin [Sphingobacteriaceae bacterium]MBK7817909.1 type II toxin-antitoxin system RelE/ParE family toxin [Sphingobacteriaceae bacterium]